MSPNLDVQVEQLRGGKRRAGHSVDEAASNWTKADGQSLAGGGVRTSPIMLAMPMAVALLSACAAMVVSTPAEFMSITAIQAEATKGLQLRKNLEVRLPTGYSRVLAANSRWRAVGRLPQGMVYRPLDGVFSIEGRQVHEAYLVIHDEVLLGFYLPGEARYSQLDKAIQIPLEAFK